MDFVLEVTYLINNIIEGFYLYLSKTTGLISADFEKRLEYFGSFFELFQDNRSNDTSWAGCGQSCRVFSRCII